MTSNPTKWPAWWENPIEAWTLVTLRHNGHLDVTRGSRGHRAVTDLVEIGMAVVGDSPVEARDYRVYPAHRGERRAS